MRNRLYLTPIVALLCCSMVPCPSHAQDADPPARVGRLGYIQGNVSFRPGSVDDWGTATLNYPLTTGDELWSDADARAEVTIGSTALRLDSYTSVEFLALDDSTTQLRLSQGAVQLRVRMLPAGETLEIDTPDGAVTLLRPGTYRVDVDSSGDQTAVTVRDGEAEVAAADSSYTVERRETATLSSADNPSSTVSSAAPPDAWERWAATRDFRVDFARSTHYVSRDMPGVADLDQYGTWRLTGAYGPVWVPRTVEAGWAPYRNGHWSWVDPWGWTWIDDAPWGFAPFHYGRWVYYGGAWSWAPGQRAAVQPVYAPALVVFVGGGPSGPERGPGEGIGWFPLAPGEVFVPAYHVSPIYVRHVNEMNVSVVTLNRINTMDVTRVHYVNREAPRGFTVVSRETFIGARPVAREVIEAPHEHWRDRPVAAAPPIAPTRESLVPPHRQEFEHRPPDGLLTRRVMVKRAPPPAPVPFVQKQQALQEHPGRPVEPATMHTLPANTALGQLERRIRPPQVQVQPTQPAAQPASPPAATPAPTPAPVGRMPHERIATPPPAAAPQPAPAPVAPAAAAPAAVAASRRAATPVSVPAQPDHPPHQDHPVHPDHPATPATGNPPPGQTDATPASANGKPTPNAANGKPVAPNGKTAADTTKKGNGHAAPDSSQGQRKS